MNKDKGRDQRASENVTPIRAGDVRLINGVAGLILKDWDEDTWLVCPVKPVDNEDDDTITGKVCFVERSLSETGVDLIDTILHPDEDDPTGGVGEAMPELAGTVYPEFIGKLLYRIFPEQALNAARCWVQLITEPKGPWHFDVDNGLPYSEEDKELMHAILRETLQKFFSEEC